MSGWHTRAVVDPPRFLARRSELGYVPSSAQALAGEPEAVSDDVQWMLTARARARELQTWATSRDRLLADVEHLRTHVRSPHVARAARALEREIAALDRKLLR